MLYRQSLNAPVFGLRREIDRLFEDTFGRGEGMSAWSPAVDVRETDQELRIDAELPGIHPEEVEITTENGILTIRGEKQMQRKEDDKDGRYHVVERSYGSFVRSFQLPQGLDESKIEANYENGMLSVHIPKTALPQPRRIQIGISQENSKGQRQVGGQGAQSGMVQNGSQQSGTEKSGTRQSRSSSGSQGGAETARAASSAQGRGESNR
ncbi:MAG TPA: Hsp20/alpha crystallin family protein [Gemmatimonadaceae bacterium]|nr:Hsp20/alpha crystallin family protein [Gemmatimonadaceae bacterium]